MAKLPSEVYKPVYAACRDLGHEWDYYRWHGSKRILLCDNCKARREEVLDGNMKVCGGAMSTLRTTDGLILPSPSRPLGSSLRGRHVNY